MFYVYLLQSLKDKNFYIGQTESIEKRLLEHNSGRVKSTKHREPFKLIGYETYDSRNEARWREFNLKKNSNLRLKFIKNLVMDD